MPRDLGLAERRAVQCNPTGFKEQTTHPPRLIEEASAVKEIIIARDGQSGGSQVANRGARQDRVPGILKGKIFYTADAFDPLTD